MLNFLDMKYLCDPHVLPTNTCPPNLAVLSDESAVFAKFTTDVQLDIADGVFAPVTSWPYTEGDFSHAEIVHELLPHAETINYEVHMMVQDPSRVGELLARMGAKRLIPHIETLPEAAEARTMFASWRALGVREIGVALLIDTPLEAVDPLTADINVVQLMSIEKIGAQGQPFDERALQRVEELHAKYPELLVSVDGGISEANIELLVRAGANRLCVGSAISKSADPARAFMALTERAMLGCAPVTQEVAV